MPDILWFSKCNYNNKNLVGGKCASLGELYHLSKIHNFNISNGFAITTTFYMNFINKNNIKKIIEDKLENCDKNNIEQINNISSEIKKLFIESKFTDNQIETIKLNYKRLIELEGNDNLTIAIRSSAIAEDLPNASFAGQQDTYLNIAGISNILLKIKECFASLFNSRAISYRNTNNISIDQIQISVAIQKMIRSDIGSAGVAFSIDPESGYNKSIVINSSFGLGELVVSGGVKPDEIILDKRTLQLIDSDPIIMKNLGDKKTKIVYNDDSETKEVNTNEFEMKNYSLTNNNAVELGRIIYNLETEYKKLFNENIGIDVEWAVDGLNKKIYIIQSRPETIHSNNKNNNLVKYYLNEKSKIIVTGIPIGEQITKGPIKNLKNIDEYKKFNKGDILVTDMTTPDWEPVMKISNGIITNKGGRTCHAAIVARELKINAVVGCGNATEKLKNNDKVTVSCIEGQGIIYNKYLDFTKESIKIDITKKLPIKIMLNLGSPEYAFTSSLLPNNGVGLARMEFIITNYIKIHPNALHDYPNVDTNTFNKIKNIIGNKDSGKWYFIKRLARGISQIASAFYPNEVVLRLSDFKSNEYRNLIGGNLYEPEEENPMIGWRGASRYYSKEYEKGFELECLAIKYARENMNMKNIIIMIPFCRTPEECEKVINKMESYGLKRGINNLQIYLMCEIPSNVIEADNFSKFIDGVSIGGNDLLQLILGIDRDSEKITYLSNDTNTSYRRMISLAIKEYKSRGVKVGFCGQQPSDSTEFCKFLINEKIDSISVTPDSVLKIINNL